MWESFKVEALISNEATKIFRCEIFSKDNDNFDGTFAKHCQQNSIPQSTKSFIDNILLGNRIITSHKLLEQSTLTISQMIVQNSMKHIRQNSQLQRCIVQRVEKALWEFISV